MLKYVELIVSKSTWTHLGKHNAGSMKVKDTSEKEQIWLSRHFHSINRVWSLPSHAMDFDRGCPSL
ncbi:hypothetical protein D3C73_1592250 [compost metagenome]